MAEEKEKKKKYEPPMVREIGGIFEQAMGASQCTTGTAFAVGACARGASASGGCAGGAFDQACSGGGSDFAGCSRGFRVTGGGCSAGTGGG